MKLMNITTKTMVPPKLIEELREALDNAVKGRRDPMTIKKACRDMDRMREETRQAVGILDVAVDLIRQGRDEV